MPTPRETILTVLHARLSTLPAKALRGEVLPERIPAAEGLLILRDGEPGEPEVTLSPLRYHYQHRAEIEAVVQGEARSAQQMQGSGGPLQGTNDRDAAFDTLLPVKYSSVACRGCDACRGGTSPHRRE